MEDLRFNEQGLLPAIIQDSESGEVLMLAYVNKIAVERTLKRKTHGFYSRSRNKYWVKGGVRTHAGCGPGLTDCDKDTLLIRVTQKKAVPAISVTGVASSTN